tara:strand:- start:728 stop:2740 length:2013 start_codon:yes stop_codon:yes gene_type:complete
MAQTTGSVAYDLRNTDFDPRNITLREYMSLYVVSAQTDGGRSLDNWENKILKNPVYQKYLDEPVIKIFDPAEKIGGKSIQAAAELAEKDLPSGGSAPTLQSRIRTLEEGVFLKLGEIDAEEGTRLAQDYRRLTDTVQKLSTRGAAKTATLQYRTSGIGELIINLEEHVKKFPDDKPIANAILLNLEMGSRPSLPTEIESQHYVVDQSSAATRILGASGADGLLIPAGTTGTKRQAKGDAPNLQPYNAPLSQRAVTILQDQSDYNRTNFGNNRRLPNFFQIEIKTGENAGSLRPVSLKDMNDVLAVTSPPGIIQKVGVKGGISPTNKPLTSSDLRKLFINAGEAAGIPKASVAALISRDTAKNTGSHGVYIGNAGEYSSVAVDELNRLSRAMWGQYSLESSDEGMRIGRESQGQILLATNTLVFGDNTEDKVKVRNYEPFGTGQPLDIKIQVGGFTAPVEQVNEDVETTRQVDNKMAGGSEYIIYSDEQVAELKAANLWNDDMQKRQDEAVQKEQTATSDVPPKVSKMDVVGDVFDRSIQTGIKGAGAAAAVYDPVGTAIEETIDTIKDKTLGKVVSGGAARKIPGVNLLIPGGFAFPTLSGDFEEADTFAKLFEGTRDDFVNMSPEELAPYRAAYKQAAEAAKDKEKQQTMFKAFGVVPENNKQGFIPQP